MNIPIPSRMKHLKHDSRGYPIPDGLYIDQNGRAHFTINDETKRLRHLIGRLCPICGLRLKPPMWFVGGPGSAFDPNGAYIDLPMHDECAHYALQVCPYLAAPNYARRIDGATLPDGVPHPTLIDQTVDPNRPKFFVAVCCKKFVLIKGGRYVRPIRPYKQVEFWQHGQMISVPSEVTAMQLAP
jgi:hypothetical protein